jgi:hypothetical protein
MMPPMEAPVSDTPKDKKPTPTLLRYLPDDEPAYQNAAWTVVLPMRVRLAPPQNDDQAPSSSTPKRTSRRKR